MAGNANFPLWTDLIKSDQSLGEQRITQAGRRWQNTAGGAEIAGFCDAFIPSTGKWYVEFYVEARGSSTASFGFNTMNVKARYSSQRDLFSYSGPGSYDNEKPFYNCGGTVWYGDSSTLTSQGTWGTGDILSLAFDCANDKIWWGVNNSYINSGNPATGTNGIAFNHPPTQDNNGWGFNNYIAFMGYQSPAIIVNFGQDSSFCGEKSTGTANAADENGYGNFYYAPPSGYLALCSANMPTAEVVDPSVDEDNQSLKICNTGVFTGTGTARSITGVGFKPDLVMIGQRSTGTTANNYWFDSTRGVGKYMILNSGTSQSTDGNSLTAFGTDGFSLGSGAGNTSTQTYMYACWKANGGTTSTNTSGTITSTVQANQDAGFSIVKYTATGTSGTVGHGLSKGPEFVISMKDGGQPHYTLATTNGRGPGYFEMSSNANYTEGTVPFGGTNPSSTTVGVTSANAGTDTYYLYCWHGVQGFSKFGNYNGSANADGPFINLDFTPQILWLKEYGSDDWGMYTNPVQDNPGVNPLDTLQRTESTNGEQEDATGRAVDFLANGFKLRTSNATFNGGSVDYFYAAWGRLPAKFPNAFGHNFE